MNTKPLSSLVLSTLFYTTLLTTTFVMPLILASHAEIEIPGSIVRDAQAAPDAQVWERSAIAPAEQSAPAPKTDSAATPPEMKRTPVDRSGPDAEMIRAGKVRAKTIKV